MGKPGCSFTCCIIVFSLGLLLISLPFCFAYEMNLIYDGNGNLITGDGKYREYNDFNQLVRVREGNSSSGKIIEEYIYHPTEDRVLIKYEYNFTGPDRAALYVNNNFVRRYSGISGPPRVNDSYFVYDENGIVAEVVRNVSYRGSDYLVINKVYYHNDHLGSTSVLTNGSGAVIEQTFYEPFGGIISTGNVSKLKYEGKEISQLTGEYDFKFRTYDPELKIFTKPDAGMLRGW